jgi:2-phospho-L-lactate guanylyltransferase
LKVFGLIPVKELSKSKERLSSVLKPKERRNFVITMLRDVLEAAHSSILNKIMVVGHDSVVSDITKEFGVYFLTDPGEGLNRAIGYGIQTCIKEGADAVLIIPADIPLIEVEDINNILQLTSENDSIVLTQSQKKGTNALMLKPPDVIKTHFGSNSFHKHINEAKNRQASLKIYQSPRVSLDIDSKEDLKRLIEYRKKNRTLKFLDKIRIKSIIK